MSKNYNEEWEKFVNACEPYNKELSKENAEIISEIEHIKECCKEAWEYFTTLELCYEKVEGEDDSHPLAYIQVDISRSSGTVAMYLYTELMNASGETRWETSAIFQSPLASAHPEKHWDYEKITDLLI